VNDQTADAEPARLHIATLQGAGWSCRTIAAHSGLSDTMILNIVHGQERCLTAVRDRICALDPSTIPSRSYHGNTPFVSRVGTFRRIQALLVMGWPHDHLFATTGVNTRALLGKGRPRVTLDTHEAIAAVYRQLANRPGPSNRTRARALARGYASPAEWDDIDNDLAPADLEEPVEDDFVDEAVVERILAGDRVPATTAERYAVVARWPSTGRPLNALARLTGWKVERYHPRDEEAA
jgi:lambda repressor-like predicted transcriptional regulator